MERIKQRLLELFKNNRIVDIMVDSEFKYISFETATGAAYTLVSAEGECTTRAKCPKEVVKIYGSKIYYSRDIETLTEHYIYEYCINCILNSL